MVDYSQASQVTGLGYVHHKESKMGIMTQKQLSAKITAIGKSQTTIANNIHEALVSAMFYAMKDGEAEPLNRILQVVGNAGNITAITHWATIYGPVYIKDGKFVVAKASRKETGVIDEATFAVHEEKMRATPWFEFNKEGNKAQNVWDTGKRLDSFLTTLGKHDFALAEHLKREAMAFNGKRAMETVNAD